MASVNNREPSRLLSGSDADVSERLRIWSHELRMRLQYARLKVDHGWTRQTLSEVENLYFHHYPPGSLHNTSYQDQPTGLSSGGPSLSPISLNGVPPAGLVPVKSNALYPITDHKLAETEHPDCFQWSISGGGPEVSITSVPVVRSDDRADVTPTSSPMSPGTAPDSMSSG